MKKRTIRTINLIMTAALLLALAGCSATSKPVVGTQSNANSSPATVVQSNTDVAPADSSNVAASKAGGKIADELFGTWETQPDKVRLTFGRDNSFVAVSEGKPAEKGTYAVIDENTLEITAPPTEPTKFKVKIDGATMQLTINGTTEPMNLKRSD